MNGFKRQKRQEDPGGWSRVPAHPGQTPTVSKSRLWADIRAAKSRCLSNRHRGCSWVSNRRKARAPHSPRAPVVAGPARASRAARGLGTGPGRGRGNHVAEVRAGRAPVQPRTCGLSGPKNQRPGGPAPRRALHPGEARGSVSGVRVRPRADRRALTPSARALPKPPGTAVSVASPSGAHPRNRPRGGLCTGQLPPHHLPASRAHLEARGKRTSARDPIPPTWGTLCVGKPGARRRPRPSWSALVCSVLVVLSGGAVRAAVHGTAALGSARGQSRPPSGVDKHTRLQVAFLPPPPTTAKPPS